MTGCRGGDGIDTISGGDGVDIVDYSLSESDRQRSLNIQLDDNGMTTFARDRTTNDIIDKLTSVEGLAGGDGDDLLVGNSQANQLSGGAGDDTLKGLQGNDVLVADGGTDYLFGGEGKDIFQIKAGGHGVIDETDNGNALAIDGVSIDQIKAVLNPDTGSIQFIKKDDGSVLFEDVESGRQLTGWQGQADDAQTLELENRAVDGCASSGTNMMVIDEGGSISQTLVETFDASADYQLSVDLANYRYGSVSSTRVSLWAGDQQIGGVDFSSAQMAELFDYGKWSALTIDIDGSAHETVDGQQLRMEVANLANDDRWDQVNVDNLRLAKLTGAMATFDSGSGGGLDSGASVAETYRIQPVIIPSVS